MSNPSIGRTIAGRELAVAGDPKRRIIVSLGMPRRVSSEEWQCKVRIDGLDAEPISQWISSVDSLDALLLGVEFIRLSLKRSPRHLVWLGDSTLFTAGGIPRQVPADLGEEFDKRIEKLLEIEEQKFRKFRARILRSYLVEAAQKAGPSHKRASFKPRRRTKIPPRTLGD
jgi:hypothetical protein